MDHRRPIIRPAVVYLLRLLLLGWVVDRNVFALRRTWVGLGVSLGHKVTRDRTAVDGFHWNALTHLFVLSVDTPPTGKWVNGGSSRQVFAHGPGGAAIRGVSFETGISLINFWGLTWG